MTTTPMLEKVARALCKNHGVEDPDMPGPGHAHVIDRDGIPTIICDHRGPLWAMWISDAQAALDALAEPDEGMLGAGTDHGEFGGCQCENCQGVSRSIFTAMIRQAQGRGE